MSTGATPSSSDDPAASTRLRAGVVGRGAIGRGVAISVVRSGHLVHFFDLRPQAVLAWTDSPEVFIRNGSAR
jgi:3-hydroxyacyl-CoA dehydrogenase